MNSRFDYVKYDDRAQKDQALLKAVFQDAEGMIDATLVPGAQKNRALAALEEAYMWCGKDLRDQQIQRNGSAPLQEERTNDSLPKAKPDLYRCNCTFSLDKHGTHSLDCASRKR